jgi:hypothetical protein
MYGLPLSTLHLNWNTIQALHKMCALFLLIVNISHATQNFHFHCLPDRSSLLQINRCVVFSEIYIEIPITSHLIKNRCISDFHKLENMVWLNLTRPWIQIHWLWAMIQNRYCIISLGIRINSLTLEWLKPPSCH